MRRLIVIAVLCVPLLSAPTTDIEDILAFNEVYNKFIRAYFGCGPSAQAFEDCIGSHGYWDVKLWKQVCARASVFK